jgi:hypothetical protein
MLASNVTDGVYAVAMTACQPFRVLLLRGVRDAFDTRRPVHSVDNCAHCWWRNAHACAQVASDVAVASALFQLREMEQPWPDTAALPATSAGKGCLTVRVVG